jgi:hypothetical protein
VTRSSWFRDFTLYLAWPPQRSQRPCYPCTPKVIYSLTSTIEPARQVLDPEYRITPFTKHKPRLEPHTVRLTPEYRVRVPECQAITRRQNVTTFDFSSPPRLLIIDHLESFVRFYHYISLHYIIFSYSCICIILYYTLQSYHAAPRYTYHFGETLYPFVSDCINYRYRITISITTTITPVLKSLTTILHDA